MKKTIIFILTGLLLAVFAAAQDTESDKEAIKKIIQSAYIKGVFVDRDADAMAKGFHSEFSMQYLHDGHLHKVSITRWMDSIKRGKQSNPEPVKAKYSCEIPIVDVTGDAAMAKIEISKDGKKVFTDYMSFYKMDNKWSIINKIYNEH